MSLLAPTISLLHVANTGNLAQIFVLSSLLYLLVANYWRSGFLAVLAIIYLLLAPYSYLLYCGKGMVTLSVYAIGGSAVAIALAHFLGQHFPGKQFLWSALRRVAWINQLALLLFIAMDSQQMLEEQIFITVALALVNSIFFAAIFVRWRIYLASAIFYFLLSYYLIVYSWSCTIWDFYTVPIGLIVLGLGVYREQRKTTYPLHQDCYLLGLLLILFPAFLQSYRGWYAHLPEPGLTNLYHSIFLSLESLALMLFGIYRKRLVFFATGLIFLIADASLVIFTYVEFGRIHQGVWWGLLGIILIVSAWLLEYHRARAKELADKLVQQHRKWWQELISWD